MLAVAMPSSRESFACLRVHVCAGTCLRVYVCTCAWVCVYNIDIVARKGLIKKGVTDLKEVKKAAACEKRDPGRGDCMGTA